MPTLAFPTIETPRLLLREIVADDAPALFAIHGDPDLMRWFGSDPLPDLAAAQGLVTLFAGWRALPNPGVRWGIQIKGSAEIVGSLGLFAWHRAWRKCTLGYELSRAAQGQGYMRESLLACLNWGFANMDLNRIEAQVHPDNAASLKSVQRMGFVEEGRLRQVGYWNGAFHDMLQHALLRSEWTPAEPA
ncbi:GNAT family N-acetyltransferase [Aquabacterium sp.]|uniref:GNAT family N-acetyltransferase n=1 Tax=Aquabacterium sp. TaxID=1872578 RepID=UPI002BCA18FE|nr:GNAT family protein [Aquabacterium sp.]HSW04966.1 GNAT family protein [Aquabacterium sp.]